MKRIVIALNAALLASSVLGTGALAAEPAKSDKGQVVPSRDDLKPGSRATIDRMDANVQRQHDRDRGAGATRAGGAATGAAAGTAAAGARAADVPAGGVRDWSQIDKNKDNLIGPDEMAEWLKQNPYKSSS